MTSPVKVTPRGWLVLDVVVVGLAVVALVLLWRLWRVQERANPVVVVEAAPEVNED